MSDLYSELLVKKKQTAKDMVVKYGLIVLTVIMAIGGLLVNGLLLVPAVALPQNGLLQRKSENESDGFFLRY